MGTILIQTISGSEDRFPLLHGFEITILLHLFIGLFSVCVHVCACLCNSVHMMVRAQPTGLNSHLPPCPKNQIHVTRLRDECFNPQNHLQAWKFSINPNLSIFSFINCSFGIISENTLSNLRSREYFSCLFF